MTATLPPSGDKATLLLEITGPIPTVSRSLWSRDMHRI
jgi:hypothetical protein